MTKKNKNFLIPQINIILMTNNTRQFIYVTY